jgi:GAF domain-containing protein
VTAFRTGQNVAVRELGAAEHALWPQYCETAASVGITSVASLPMRVDGHVVGALDLFSPVRRDWDDEELAAAEVMANMATAYLLHASHHRRQVELTTQLQTALDSRTVIEQAKGLLAADHEISMDAAFELMRRHARSHHETVHDVADRIVARDLTL